MPDHAPNLPAIIRRLCDGVDLIPGDAAALMTAAQERVRVVLAEEDILREGDRASSVQLVLSGWAIRYKMLSDGRRQILGFVLPGDVCTFDSTLLLELDHSISSATQMVLSEISMPSFDRLTSEHPRLNLAFWRQVLMASAIQREWVLNLGQRVAFERLAHMFCEVFLRLRSVGLTQGTSCGVPLTQADLADATGLSAVHVNRTLQELRAAGLISLASKRLTIPDLEALQDAALFHPAYLQLGREPRTPDLMR